MGRVINTDSTGKQRNQLMRTAAELLRRLSQKADLDTDAKDMVALLIYCLREIDEGIDSSAAAWEKRDYWMKAEEFRQKWSWPGQIADALQAMIFRDDWQQMPQFMIKLLPYFADIKITKFTRSEALWHGAYNRLMQEKPPTM